MGRRLTGLSPLHWALLASVGVHAGLLTLRLATPESPQRVLQDAAMEVILVNARSEKAPAKAQAIAQAPLQGGGDIAQGRSSSALRHSPQRRDGDSLEPDAQPVAALQQQQEQLLASLRAQIAKLSSPPLLGDTRIETLQAHEARRQALANRLAEIERRIREQNARPKKRFIGPSTRETVYARYYDAVRRKIEDHGTRNFPQAAGRKLYGELTMAMTISHQGRVLTTEVIQGSGNMALDRRSEAMVRSLTFGGFDKAMRQRADQIVVISRFRYARDHTLSTQLSSQ